MKTTAFLFLLLMTLHGSANGQSTSKRPMSRIINVPMYSHIFPSVSGDGNQLIYLTNYANIDGFEMRYTYKTGSENWEDPKPLSTINKPNLDHTGSFCLSYDGNTIVFASRRSPGIGGYDIWFSEKNGATWSAPQNPGKPLNSTANEGNPSLSADGKSVYFMRCESMDNTRKSNCRIYVSQRQSANRWSEPVAMPEYINAGNTVTPRILVDNRTLFYASSKPGGKGLLDLYSTKLVNGKWSEPRPLDFLNTPQNDEYVSIPARGDQLFYNETYKDQQNIFIAGIPQEFRPDKVLMIEGKVAYDDGKKPSDDVLVQAYTIPKNELYISSRLRPFDNGFTVFLTEGAVYDFSAFPQNGGHTYFSRINDLTSMTIPQREELNIPLTTLKPNTVIPLTTIGFEQNTATLADETVMEMKRIAGFLKKNPGKRIEIAAYMETIIHDSLPSPDLTESYTDSVEMVVERPIDEEIQETDSIDLDDIVVDNDSSAFEFITEEPEVDTIMVAVTTFHNDRTQKMADSVIDALMKAGVPANLIVGKGYGDSWTKSYVQPDRNYWVELRIVNK
ncbi:MAG: hypothetical protein U5K79_02995 [Cyclobacteriaceae bacterium]|nr:hypothetical protein [Cyclobacteriaceae bacterium]